ncbi:RNA polymerase I transcription factor UAF protein [Dioscorea alata]|uniref:RNA polymerase I transcription factor UAF protein n=2 Tax=Dioscorea alata TaxID=55571 RepID=A0ACB7WBT2_DIOAL|nr:RNA polymerase I transcription factor UAF protein [Dioscorea alata]KAH7685186.1 RNA polymerase I transcription factor UAF protein [Dioscorea alata]
MGGFSLFAITKTVSRHTILPVLARMTHSWRLINDGLVVNSFQISPELLSRCWHTCSNCSKSSTFQCFCCPNSFCQACFYGADFVQVKKRTRGFCGNCLKLTTLIEENVDADSDGEKVDFNDTSTYEFLFKDYWEIVKEKEGLTLVDLHAATALLKSGESHKNDSDLDNFPEEDLISEDDSLEDKCDEEIVIFDDVKVKCRKAKTPLKRSRSKKKTFVGWGSKELLQFLGSVGKYTEQPLTQLDACEIVKDYIHEHNLFHPVQKKKVVLDENLYSLFRKRSLKLHKIYSLLESHFAENDDSDDEYSFSSEDGGDLFSDKRKRRKTSGSKDHKPASYGIRENVLVPNLTCYAAIIGKNIQSVYLRRSLILKMLEDSETLEHKVIGCFVRVKGDPKDFFYSPQKPYELGQVIGIKKTAQAYKLGDSSIDVVLQISNMFKDIQINMLSDEDFEEEECEDLRQLVKKGLFKRPTVGELQEKIQIVHEDITSHAIDREILKLQRQIDRANVNGWRRERFECIDRRNLLRTPAERLRLLKEMPKVIADIEDDTVAICGVVNLREDNKDDNLAELPSPVEDLDSVINFDAESPIEDLETAINFAVGSSSKDLESGGNVAVGSPIEDLETVINFAVGSSSKDLESGGNVAVESPSKDLESGGNVAVEFPSKDLESGGNVPVESPVKDLERGGNVAVESSIKDVESGGNAAVEAIMQEPAETELKTKEIKENSSLKIDVEIKEDDLGAFRSSKDQIISIDDDEESVPDACQNDEASTEETCEVWHYIDPSGKEQGPFSLASLRYWKEEGFFDDDFKVWRSSEPKSSAILLTEALLPTSSS